MRVRVKHQEDALTGAPLPEYFEGVDKGTFWEMWCKRCQRGWRLNKPAPGAGNPPGIHPGNLLHLLNHAGSHK